MLKRLIPPFALVALALPAAAQQTPGERLGRLFAEEWEWRLREDPLLATQVGDARYNDRLPRVAVADQERRAGENRVWLARLRTIPRDSLDAGERINYDLFEREKRLDMEESELHAHLIPITNREGFHTYFPEQPDRVPLGTTADYERYIARLGAFRQYAREHVELMRQGLREGMVLPSVSVQGIESTLRPHVVDDPTKSLLWKPFAAFPAGVPEADRARLAAAGREAIMSSVVAGYREFMEFMLREYVPGARRTIGASALPNGRAYYAQRVRSYTTLDVTPAEVHRTGLAEVARIRAEMETVMRGTGFRGTFAEFLTFLRTDPRFRTASADELLMRTALVLKRMTVSCRSSSAACRARHTASAPFPTSSRRAPRTIRSRRATGHARGSTGSTCTTCRTAPRTRSRRSRCTRPCRGTTCSSRSSRSWATSPTSAASAG